MSDDRAEYLRDPANRRDFVRAAAFLAGLAQVGGAEERHRLWLLAALEMLASRDHDGAAA